jgi:protein involved in polysaccharide export with SLBB domain
MIRHHVAAQFFACAIAVAMICTLSPGIAVPQEKAVVAPAKPPPREKFEPKTTDGLGQPIRDEQHARDAIAKMIAEYDLKPPVTPTIPDKPPPHEGAMISLPLVVEPPDLVLVEVLEALPGRPISGERLVRPDGKISLGFYGEVDVKGLRIDQIKVAIIAHLRKYLSDANLGVLQPLFEGATQMPVPEFRHDRPDAPKGQNPFSRDQQGKTRPSSSRSRPGARFSDGRATPRRAAATQVPIRRVLSQSSSAGPQDQPKTGRAPSSAPIESNRQRPDATPNQGVGQRNQAIDEAQGKPEIMPPPDYEGPWFVIPPAESLSVFVDVSAYNSKNYYVQGDVAVTGSFPWTGHETVLDALQYAGGLLPTAEPKHIRLVRPDLGGNHSRIYKVDLHAIQEQGDVTTNYQIFPNDRLIIGRNDVVQKTVDVDRLAAPIHTVLGSILYDAQTLRALQTARGDNADELMKNLVDFWANQLARKGELKFDEQTLREVLMQSLKAAPAGKPQAK